ncbi:MAG: energy transducer TonB [Bacteroidota bacterium]
MKQSFILIAFTLLLAACSILKRSESNAIVDYPDKEAAFPGGQEAMQTFLANNIRYPEEALENGDHGKVYIKFIVEKNGSLSKVEILRGVSDAIDAESVRVIRSMPNWEPAEMNGRVVRAYCRIPLNYKLAD